MNDRPSAEELLGAVQRFLQEDVVPALDGPRRFHARVAANVLGIVSREISRKNEDLQAEWKGLVELLDLPGDAPAGAPDLEARVREAEAELLRRIRSGEADAGHFREAVLAHLGQTVDAKLAVSVGPPKETT